MKQSLYLVRHAHASDAPTDPERPVSPKGKKQMKRICTGLRGKKAIAPTVVWHSQYLRAIETAAQLCDGLGISVPMKTTKGLTPFDDPAKIAELVEGTHESLMIVGHEPHLSGLASILLSGSQSLAYVVFPKASILRLSRLTVGNQRTPWHVEWHISHKIFK